MKPKLMSKILAFISCIICVLTAYAQQTTSEIQGQVSDGNSGIAGATISVIHQPTGTKYSTVSRKDGRFNLPNLRVGGPYIIEISYVGKEPSRTEDIYLKLAEPYVLNVTMKETGSTLANVRVLGSNKNSVLNANRTGTTTNIGRREIEKLPTITRSINDLTRLTPQASSTSTGSIGGGNFRQNYITVDGADFNNTFGIGGNLPAGGSPISIDALDEISINVSPYDIKQSGFIGSAINAVTRSGTNSFSGSAYTFFRTENQQGNKVAYNTPLMRQNLDIKTYGFRLGGPIIKNKLFFFVNYEQGKTTVPGQQNLASTPGAVFGSSSNIARPTADSLNLISDYLRTTYGYETGPYQNYDFVSDNTRIVGRIDWNINNHHRFNVRYSQVESKSPNFPSTSRSPFSAFPNTRTSIFALPYKNANYYQEANFYSLAAELNSTFGKFSNTFRGTYTNQNDPRSSDSEDFPFVDILSNGNPYTSFGYEPFSKGNLREVKSYSFVDNLSWTSEKHSWTVGAQADFQSTRNGFQRFATSYYTFASFADFKNGAKPQDFGITYSLLPNYAQAYPRFKFAQYSIYGQDEISITNKFRLTAGLRLDLPTYPGVDEIKTHPLVAAATFANGEQINTGVLPKVRILWSPRIGFNWDIRGDRTLQLRGGTGIFTGRIPTVWIVSQSGDAGLIQITQTYIGQANTPGPFNPNPNAYRPTVQPTPGTAVPSTISAMDKNFKFPQTWKSSLAIDVKLPWGIVGSLEGIVNKDLNVALGRNANLVDPTPLNVAGYPDNRPIYPSANNLKFINPLTSANAATNPSTIVPNGDPRGTQAFNAIVLNNAKKGYYYSITAKLEKQLSKGLSASIAYVRSQSKVLYDGSGDQLLNTWSLTQIVNNANNPELSYANYIVPDRLVASVSYRKEYFKHLATTVSLFYEGSISGRFSYTYTNDFNRDGQTNDLIYIPKDPSEITFVDQTYGSGASAVTYTAKQQSDIFFRYIEQDKYLSSRRGQYAERNGGKMPWRNQVDVKLVQDIFTGIGGKRNTLQFTLDIFNFGNLLNKEWSIFKLVNAPAILAPRNTTGSVTSASTGTTYGMYNANGTNKPVFSLAQGQGSLPVTTTFRDNNSITSTFFMQFGLRYIFN